MDVARGAQVLAPRRHKRDHRHMDTHANSCDAIDIGVAIPSRSSESRADLHTHEAAEEARIDALREHAAQDRRDRANALRRWRRAVRRVLAEETGTRSLTASIAAMKSFVAYLQESMALLDATPAEMYREVSVARSTGTLALLAESEATTRKLGEDVRMIEALYTEGKRLGLIEESTVTETDPAAC